MTEQNVEVGVGERFQGGFCTVFNTPLPDNNSCKPCIHYNNKKGWCNSSGKIV